MELPGFVDKETWNDFVEYRQEIRKPLSDIAQKRMISRLAKLHADGYDANATLDLAMSEGWRGIWPTEECKRKVRPASHGEGPKIEDVKVNQEAGRAHLRMVRGALK